MIQNIESIIPELFLVCFTLMLLVACLYMRTKFFSENSNIIGALVLFFTSILVLRQEQNFQPILSGFYSINNFTSFFKVLILLLSGAILFLSNNYLKKNDLHIYEFPILICFAVLGMLIMVSSNDLMVLYIGVEMQSLSLYIIAAFRRDNLRSTEAGLKYFILGALSSGILLYGISLIYGSIGSTQFDDIYLSIMNSDNSLGLQIGMVFLISGIAFKFSSFPFHMWTPDVYEGAPTPVTAFLAIAPKLASGAMLAKVLFDIFGGVSDQWQLIVIFLSGGSMIIGAFGAIAQKNIKRMLAFSSIGHVGFALMGIAAVSPEGLSGFIIYLFLYSIMLVGVFAFILNMERDGVVVTDIYSLSLYSKDQPGKSFAFSIILFSLAGIPPLAGFICKLYVFMAVINSGIIILAIIGALASVVGAFYYLRLVYIIYFSSEENSLDRKMPVSHFFILIIASSAMLVGTYNLLGIEPYTRLAAESLLN